MAVLMRSRSTQIQYEVTTSDYGPDAYEFANGKPITLLNGANLLHLLEKHGTKAHINLVEARIALGRPSTTS